MSQLIHKIFLPSPTSQRGPHSFIHSFNKYLLNICSDQCPKLDSEDTVMNKIQYQPFKTEVSKLFLKRTKSNYFRLVGHIVSIITVQLCCPTGKEPLRIRK